jgi:phosphonate transport system substrate-binding protein
MRSGTDRQEGVIMCSVLRMLLVVLALAFTLPLRAQLELEFGVYAADKPTAVVRRLRPVLDDVEAAVGRKLGDSVRIRMHVARTREQAILELVTARVDFSRLGPASYVEAKQANPELSILAAESEQGTKSFYGVVCVREGSRIRSVAELRGKTFAFPDPMSTVGRYISQQYMLGHGIRAPDLAEYAYLGRHDRVGAAVGNGRYDAGALKEDTFLELVASGEPIRSIARFANVSKPWVAGGELPGKTREMLRQALLDLKDPVALAALRFDGFLEGDDRDYAATRRAIDENVLFFETTTSPSQH